MDLNKLAETVTCGIWALYKQARNKLTKEIRETKRSYSEKLKNSFSANDPAAVWGWSEKHHCLQEPGDPLSRRVPECIMRTFTMLPKTNSDTERREIPLKQPSPEESPSGVTLPLLHGPGSVLLSATGETTRLKKENSHT
ncbi:hypothetical protein XENORESO_006429 [Xenotaenia resolanae]|uniref:Uncharacterized protein n=1 Tax=Xenotaenia resolanae TaxID=208358 RepID=A0ABV0W1D8_9TELE